MRRMALAACCLSLLTWVAIDAQQPGSARGAAVTPPKSADPELNARCGGRNGMDPLTPCQSDVDKMLATLKQFPDAPPAAPQKPRKVLAWSRLPSVGYQHSSIPLAMRLIEELGRKTGAWTTTTGWALSDMTAENLAQHDAIFLSSATGNFLDDSDQAATAARRKALLDFIRNGKGIAGIHATGDSYHGRATSVAGGAETWPEWDKIIGGYFKFHWNYPTPITVRLEDPQNPINAPFKGRNFNLNDEVYTFAGWSRNNVHVLMSIDYSLMSDADRKLEQLPRTDGDYALAWIRPEQKGRLFFQALGHHESIYWNNPAMLQHILAGMQYVIGDLKVTDKTPG